MNWKDIDTIPERLKDGREVLLWCGWPIEGVWDLDQWLTRDDFNNPIFMVTHYMEIVPPKNQKKLKIKVDING